MADAMKNLARAANSLCNEAQQQQKGKKPWWKARKPAGYVNRGQWLKSSNWHTGWHAGDWSEGASAAHGWSGWTHGHWSQGADWPTGWTKQQNDSTEGKWTHGHWPQGADRPTGWTEQNNDSADGKWTAGNWPQGADGPSGWTKKQPDDSGDGKWTDGHWPQGADGWWAWSENGDEGALEDAMSAMSLEALDDSTPKTRMVAELPVGLVPAVGAGGKETSTAA
eukprot:GEMP01094569.1.p1 GENE.GEMP01094569.1~~GEMP01094569.1.p1  ORF type:complete len:236 (+),score=66.80 GEMP01094569.1:40-708(+)